MSRQPVVPYCRLPMTNFVENYKCKVRLNFLAREVALGALLVTHCRSLSRTLDALFCSLLVDSHFWSLLGGSRSFFPVYELSFMYNTVFVTVFETFQEYICSFLTFCILPQ
jgi:hypothetical protein